MLYITTMILCNCQDYTRDLADEILSGVTEGKKKGVVSSGPQTKDIIVVVSFLDYLYYVHLQYI